MYNCFFDDTNYMASVRVASAFKDDSHGYWKGPMRELKKNLDEGRERLL